MSRIAIIPGSGIGPEVTAEAVKVLQAVQERSGVDLHLAYFDYGTEKGRKMGLVLTDDQIEELRRNFDAILVGDPGNGPDGDPADAQELIRKLHQGLDLFVHCRPIRLLNEKYCPLKDRRAEDVRFAVFSDNTEGIMAGFGGTFKKHDPEEVALKQCLYTRQGTERILRHAFEHARVQGLKKVALAYQGGAAQREDDLVERTFQEIRKDYPEIESNSSRVGSVLVQLVRAPERFEVIISNNLYGDVIADLGAQLAGGMGLAASADLHPGRISLFMPASTVATNRAGQDVVNPLGAILSAALMFEHLGLDQEADWVNCAVKNALDTGNVTHDLGGRLGTRQVGDFTAQQIRKGAC